MRLPCSWFLIWVAAAAPFLTAPLFGADRVAADPLAIPQPCRLLVAPTGGADYDRFGWSVSGAGDVNGDGYADVVVGAYAAYYGDGQAYVYYGGPNADDVADLTLSGHMDGEGFGGCVSGAGDVNGDGYADVIVGTGFGSGRAYVYFGGPGVDGFADLTLSSTVPRDAFGMSVAGVGDVNGDGYSDVVVGAGASDSGKGRAYLYFGGPSMDNVPDLILTGQGEYSRFGGAISSAGDVNGDGYPDIIIGADGTAPDPGHAYVFCGGPAMDGAPDLILTGEAAYRRFGVAASGAGDVNGDGYDDVIVGAEGDFSGRAYVHYGGAGMDAIPDLTFTGSGGWDLFGFSVAGPGDVNRDGFADLLVGAAWDSSAGKFAGRAFVYYGGSAADTAADLTLSGEGESFFGEALAAAGDFDGDGTPDIIIGAWHWAESLTSNPGRAYVISTQPALLAASVEIDPRVINLKSHGPWVTAYIEPSGFDPAIIDMSSLRLAGAAPATSKIAIVGDRDANGLPDLTVKFGRGALDPLLTPGTNRLEVTGSLVGGARFRGVDSVRVIDPGRGPAALSVAPNPLNPSALLRFETTKPGLVLVQIFDLNGRLVGTLLDLPDEPAGTHEVRIGACGGRGRCLGSGVYFLRVRTVEGDRVERIVVVK